MFEVLDFGGGKKFDEKFMTAGNLIPFRLWLRSGSRNGHRKNGMKNSRYV